MTSDRVTQLSSPAFSVFFCCRSIQWQVKNILCSLECCQTKLALFGGGSWAGRRQKSLKHVGESPESQFVSRLSVSFSDLSGRVLPFIYIGHHNCIVEGSLSWIVVSRSDVNSFGGNCWNIKLSHILSFLQVTFWFANPSHKGPLKPSNGLLENLFSDVAG